ncbi:DUF3995 domain-containing protein [Daejeonella sp.]|uniref:DUF3995 domain-containing protein n=1 Tax=Daejeonella sp. TaxID=2805397 RepID=UPI0030BB5D80
MIKIAVSLILFSIFLGLSLLHFYWGTGRKGGFSASLPSREDGTLVLNPKIIDCFIVGTGLLAFAVFSLTRGGLLYLEVPNWILEYGLSIIAFVFAVRAFGDFKYVGFFKTIKNTTFGRMDTKYYSPLCLLIV